MNHTPLEDQVHDALHRRVDPIQRAPLTVTDVRGRARRIQRRRAVAAGAAVAAVLAIAVPVGLSMNGPNQRSIVEPAPDVPDPAPTVRSTVTIDPRRAPVGDPTSITLIDVVAPSVTVAGETTALPADPYIDQIVAYLDGWMAVIGEVTEAGEVLSVQQLDADLRVVDRVTDVSSALTVSPDRTRIAWAEHDGTSWSVVDRDAAGAREERRTTLPPSPESAEVRVVGFLPDDGLVIGVRDPRNGTESTEVVLSDGTTRPLEGFLKPVSSSATTGLVAGQISSSDDGSCSGVTDPGEPGTTVWETCDNTVGEFSPDGQHLAGYAAYLDGYGSPTLSILSATTGKRLVHFDIAGGRRSLTTFNTEVVWEDDSHLVTTVVTGGQQYVVRLGLDGSVERIETGAEDPTLNPIRLQP